MHTCSFKRELVRNVILKIAFFLFIRDFVENPMHRKKMMYPVYINIKFMKVIGDENVTFCHKCISIFHKIMFIVCTVG